MGEFIAFGEIMFRFHPEGYLRLVQADKMEVTIAGGEANVRIPVPQYLIKIVDCVGGGSGRVQR